MSLAAVLVAFIGFLASAQNYSSAPSPLPGIDACWSCHREIVESYRATAHFSTSRPAGSDTIRGGFAEGRNVLRTRAGSVYFKMEQRADGFYQTGYQKGLARTERFDLVIGSGRRGQSYLYWKGDLLFQLPISYLAATDGWINSPGYIDGSVYFDRLIPPRCLECHSTYFRFEGSLPGGRYRRDYALGISCQKCHGEGREHAELRNPARFRRDRRIDVCALCHSGMREARRPSFTYRPGEDLDAYLMPETDRADARPDVHGNQVALLRKSRCFAASREMSCSTCHNVHNQERDLSQLAQKCLACHESRGCKLAARLSGRIAEHCIECHMPSQESNVISIQTAGKRFFQPYRTHDIGIYREATRRVLQSLGKK